MAAHAMHRLALALTLLATAATGQAHERAGPLDALASTALLKPGAACIAAALAFTAVVYGAGLSRLWRASAPGRGIRVPEVVAFGAGWALLALALLGPLDTWAGRSFAAHMVQHEVLMLLAAPLLVRGRPLAVWAWALSPAMRRRAGRLFASPAWQRAWRTFTRPLGATMLQLTGLFAWHVPAWFDLAVTHAGVHALQHASFLVAALCFWWALRAPVSGRIGATDAAAGVALACLFVTMLATGALVALLTFAPTPWYRAYAGAASALADQQLGGLLMWVPGGTVYLVAGLWRAWRLLAHEPPALRGEADDQTARNLASISR